jgi:hypothetical protein
MNQLIALRQTGPIIILSVYPKNFAIEIDFFIVAHEVNFFN